MSELFGALTLLFVTAAAIIFAIHRHGLPVYPAYIMTGVLAGYLVDLSAFLDLAYVGMLFLIFFVGLHTRTEHLSREWTSISLVSFLQIGGIAAAVTILMTLIGAASRDILLVGVAAALSSTFVDQDIVQREVRLNLLHGRIAEGINILQDIVAVVLLTVFLTSPVTAATLYSVGVSLIILSAAFFGRHTAAHMLNRVTQRRPELLMITGLAVLLVVITTVDTIGVPAVIGAYATGVLLSRPVANTDLLDALDPLRDFFTAFTFIFIGALLTVPSPYALVLAGGLTVVSLIVVPLIVFRGLLWTGHDSRTAYLTASRLDQVSEFAVIAVILGVGTGTFQTPVLQGILLAFAITLITSALTAHHSEQLYETLSTYIDIHESVHATEQSHVADELKNHVIIAGYGNTGQALVDQFTVQDPPLVVVDYDPEATRTASADGVDHVFGDMLHPATWDRVNADAATLIVSTIPQDDVNDIIRGLDTDATKLLITGDQQPAGTDTENVYTVSRTQLTEQAVVHIIQHHLDQYREHRS